MCSRKLFLITTTAATLFACGGPQETAPTPPPAEPTLAVPAVNAGLPPDASIDAAPQAPEPPPVEQLRLSIVSAELKGRTAHNRDWDDGSVRLTRSLFPPHTRYLRHHPILMKTANTVGVPVTHNEFAQHAQNDAAADPMVFVEIGQRVYRSPAQLKTFNPVWDFPFVFRFGEGPGKDIAGRNTPVRLHVVDFDGAGSFDVVGTKLLTLGELVGSSIRSIGPFGRVDKLTLQIERQPAAHEFRPKVHRFAVRGRSTWTVTKIEVTAGQRVTIEAADEVCTKGDDLSRCSGPEGQARPSASSNVPGFERIRHGVLIGAIGDTRFVSGRKSSFVAPSSGVLRMGVNDKHVANNSGSYEVRVTVSGP